MKRSVKGSWILSVLLLGVIGVSFWVFQIKPGARMPANASVTVESADSN